MQEPTHHYGVLSMIDDDDDVVVYYIYNLSFGYIVHAAMKQRA